jgi:PAS domain S-box-containing protein
MIPDKFKKESILRWGIAQKFILCILSFSFLVTLVLTGIQLYMGYHAGLDAIKKSIRQVEESYLPGIINTLWVSDTQLLTTQLSGMMKLGDVQYIDVADKDETLAKAGVFTDEHVIIKEFPLLYTYENKTISLGRLRLIFTLKNLHNRLMKNAIAIIISQSILLLLVSGFMFVIFYLLVARHLYALVNYTNALGVTTLETPFSLKRYKRSLGKDEFDILANAVNDMRMSLNDSYSQLRGEILERKQAEASLRDNEGHLKTLVNTIPDLVWVKNLEGVYLSCNSKFERFFDAKEAQIVGKTDYDFVDQILANSFREKDRAARKAGVPTIYEEDLIYADDGHGEISETVKAPMYDHEGQCVGILGISRDISDRKQQEAEKAKLKTRLQQSQKMEAIGTLAGGIAHDFNNILYPLIGFAEMLQEDLPRESNDQESVTQILQAALRAKDLVKQTLAFSRQSSQELKPVRLQSTLKEALTLLNASIPKTIDIQTQIDADCGMVVADATKIHQVVMNLATNAYHAMEESGGRLTIVLEQTQIDATPLGLSELLPGHYALLKITDTGTGIDPSLMDKIFDPYFTTKETNKGTGLGLSVVQGIIKSCNGAIHVYSEPGRGTQVHIYLPTMKKMKDLDHSDLSEPVQGGRERILIIDDEEMIVKMEKQILERLGYHVTPLTGSVETLALFKENPDAFDLIITDMTIPQMTGIQLANEIRSIRPDIPVIICSGFSDQINSDTSKEMGIQGYLMKPVITRELATTIRAVLDDTR